MSANYSFAVQLATHFHAPPGKLLDFGCGQADVAALAQDRGYDAYGADTFQGIGDSRDNFEVARSKIGGKACAIEAGSPLPFADRTFDVIISNQVFEHVDDLTGVVSELARVAKRGGILIAMMPTSEILWEDHIKMPFVHRLANGSLHQKLLMHVLAKGGFGRRDVVCQPAWTAMIIQDLAQNIFHRSVPEYVTAFSSKFQLVSEAEPIWARQRIARSQTIKWSSAVLESRYFDGPLRGAVRRLAGAVLIFERHEV